MSNKDKNNMFIIPEDIQAHLKDLLTGEERQTPDLDLEQIRKKIFEMNNAKAEIDAINDKNSMRKFATYFFMFFLAFQMIVTFGLIFYCVHLMSNDRLSPNEYEWIRNVLSAGVWILGTEIVVYLGFPVRYLFGNKKDKDDK